MGKLIAPKTAFTPKAPRINRLPHKDIAAKIVQAEQQFREASNLPQNVELDSYVDVEGDELVVTVMPKGIKPLVAPRTIIAPNIDPDDLTPAERGEPVARR